MKTRLIALILTAASAALAQYQYDYTANPITNDATNWLWYGTEVFPSNGGVTFNGTPSSQYGPNGEMLYTTRVSGANYTSYEIDATIGTTYYASYLQPPYSGGAKYVLYFRGALSYDGLVHCGGSAAYLSAEIDIPVSASAYYGDDVWGGTLTINRCNAGTQTTLASVPNFIIWNGMTLKALIYDGNNLFSGSSGTNLCLTSSAPTSDVINALGTTGLNGYNGFQCWSVPNANGIYPGFGGTGGAYFSAAAVGHYSTIIPSAVNQQSVATSVFPTSVSVRWQGVTPSSGEPPILGYMIWRNGVLLTTSPIGGNDLMPWQNEFTDASAQPSTAYTYTIRTVDYHCNMSVATTITVTTPPAGAVDPHRMGVRQSGSYWGGGGEELDLLSGNLNYSLPLVTPQLRNGQQIPVSLTYNSQNWLQDTGVNWKQGNDIGYGFGWRVQIGSITPYYSSWGGVDHFVFADGTGAEYALPSQSNSIWTSPAIHIWFDSVGNVLHFPEGTIWYMGSISGGNEADAGTMYPTVIQDVSGNAIFVNYDNGAGLSSGTINTSGRVTAIEDVRATGGCPSSQTAWQAVCSTYNFTYLKDASGVRLSAITNTIGTAETWNFTYSLGQSLRPPFGSDSTFTGLTTNYLASVSSPGANPYSFTYDTPGTTLPGGELTQVTFPFGGHLRWDYISDPYSGSRYLRAVGKRYLAADSAGATEWTYPITWDNAASAVVHGSTTIADASGVGSKTWNFTNSTGAPAWQIGLASEFLQKANPTSSQIFTDDTYAWSQDPGTGGSGTPMVLPNPYISAKTSVLDEGTPNQQSALTTQTHDVYGNVTQAAIYPFNNATTPLETYNNTWLKITYGPSYYYTSPSWYYGYIFNRLLTTTLTTGGTQKTLVQNYYDGQTASGQPANPCGSTYQQQINFYSPGIATLYPSTTFGSQGLLTGSVNPATSTCNSYYVYGGVHSSARSDGSAVYTTPTTSTNYAAPSGITTQSYGQSLAYNAFLGITQTTGLNGEQMTVTYDSLGRPATAKSPYWTSGNPTVAYSYSASGVIPVTQTTTGPNGVTITTLDGLGRPVHVQRGDAATVDATTSFTDTVYAACACSPLGKIQKVSQPYASGATPAWTVYAYDGVGRAVSVQQADGASTTTYAYSGNQTTVTDPAGNSKTFTRDVLGNLITVVEPDPNNPPSGTLTSNYSYDWMNHVSQVSMTRGSVTQMRTFAYSDAGLLTSATNPENGTVTYTYNPTNTLQYKHDAKGQDTVYTYDSQQRVTMVQYYPTGKTNAEDQCQRVTYTYDTSPNGFFSNANGTGRLTSAAYGPVNSSGASCIAGVSPTMLTEYYAYHAAGGVTQKSFVATRTSLGLAKSFNVAYSYNNAGQVSTVAYPMAAPFGSGSYPAGTTTFTSGYDSMGRQVRLTDSNSWTWAQNAVYDYAGRLGSVQYLAGASTYTTQTMGYNVNSQLSSIGWSTPAGYGPTGTIQYSYSATQNNGQITQVNDGVSGETVAYQYDALKRLISAASNPNSGGTPTAWTQTFQYDGFENLTAKVLNGMTTSIPVNGATNQLAGPNYDSNGNMTSGQDPLGVGVNYTYDISNRITSAAAASGGAEYYWYAPDNKRIYRLNVNGSTQTEEWTFYGARGERLGVYSLGTSGFTPLRTDVYFGGRSILNANNAVFADRGGTNRASGARFYPYGDEITSSSNDREKFETYTRDSYTGLDYADQRFYASTYGRFDTPDPYAGSSDTGNPQSLNRYSYTLGDPVNVGDPSGLCSVLIGGLTMAPDESSGFGAIGVALGADVAYPYSGENLVSGGASVLSQGIFGPNSSTAVALAAITSALSTNSGSIDIVAYSGGAGAFSTAYGELSSTDQARIGNILYVSPGAGGELVTNSFTSVVLGSGTFDNIATAATYIPPGTPITDTACAHSDFACLARSAQSQLSTMQSNGACSAPTDFWLKNNGTVGTVSVGATGAGGGTGVVMPTRPNVPVYAGGTRRMPVFTTDPKPVVTTTITYQR